MCSEVRLSVPPGEGLSSIVSLSSLAIVKVGFSTPGDGSCGESFSVPGPGSVVALVADDEAYR